MTGYLKDGYLRLSALRPQYGAVRGSTGFPHSPVLRVSAGVSPFRDPRYYSTGFAHFELPRECGGPPHSFPPNRCAQNGIQANNLLSPTQGATDPIHKLTPTERTGHACQQYEPL